MAKLPEIKIDQTLLDINTALEVKQKLEKPRHYLGMSQIGDPCWRKLFYSFRNVKKREISASGLKAIEDGFAQEAVMIERLKMLPYIDLHADDGEGNQIGFKLLLDHFRGHADGMIKGIKVAPLTWHVWEHKSVNQTKFNKLKKLIADHGEKAALQLWDETYFGQAVIYMHNSQTTRHYLTVTTPGGRDCISCRTDYNKKIAEDIIEKAKVIIFDNWHLPAKLSENRESFKCKFCDYKGICHDGDFPLVHCKTCRYSEIVKDGQRKCLKKDLIIEETMLNLDNCPDHVYNPALISAKVIDQQESGSIYETESGVKFANCTASAFPELKGKLDTILPSIDLYKKIKNVNNLTKESAVIQKDFDGEIGEEGGKAWDIIG